MKSSHLKWIALGYSWTARLTRYARIASVVSAVASAAAHPAASAEQTMGGATRIDRSERVYQYDLSGPRVGGTFAPDGTAMTQFGWHFESQASPGPRGPWFIVERVFLVGGVEQNTFVPNGTLVFGVRLPSSFEFGLGPSVTLRANRGFQTRPRQCQSMAGCDRSLPVVRRSVHPKTCCSHRLQEIGPRRGPDQDQATQGNAKLGPPTRPSGGPK